VGVPLAEKMELKVLGREFEGEPFFKRVSLNNRCKMPKTQQASG
jgi:hypothetical protein